MFKGSSPFTLLKYLAVLAKPSLPTLYHFMAVDANILKLNYHKIFLER